MKYITANTTPKPNPAPVIIPTISPMLIPFIDELFPVDSPNVGKTFA